MRVFKTREARYDEEDGFQLNKFEILAIPTSRIYIMSKGSITYLILRDKSTGYGYSSVKLYNFRKQHTENTISKIFTVSSFYLYKTWARVFREEEEFEKFLYKHVIGDNIRLCKLLQIIEI